MTKIIVKEIVWDDWNREHIKRHNLSVKEIVKASQIIIYHKRTYKGRYLVICRESKRLITIVLKRESKGKYYLITARDASKKERRKIYGKEKK